MPINIIEKHRRGKLPLYQPPNLPTETNPPLPTPTDNKTPSEKEKEVQPTPRSETPLKSD